MSSFSEWVRSVGSWFKTIPYIAHGKMYGPAPMRTHEQEINEEMLAQNIKHDDRKDEMDHATQHPEDP